MQPPTKLPIALHHPQARSHSAMADFTEEFAEDVPSTEDPSGDVEMAEDKEETANGQAALPFPDDDIADPPAPRVTFLSYLASPVVTLLVGNGKEETILAAIRAC